MNYFPFHIGDYQCKTKHLSPIEDVCYFRLLLHYYKQEKPIAKDLAPLARILMLVGHEDSIKIVLSEFFEDTVDGWRNKRADDEIEKYRKFIEKSSKGGKSRGKKTIPIGGKEIDF